MTFIGRKIQLSTKYIAYTETYIDIDIYVTADIFFVNALFIICFISNRLMAYTTFCVWDFFYDIYNYFHRKRSDDHLQCSTFYQVFIIIITIMVMNAIGECPNEIKLWKYNHVSIEHH